MGIGHSGWHPLDFKATPKHLGLRRGGDSCYRDKVLIRRRLFMFGCRFDKVLGNVETSTPQFLACNALGELGQLA